MMTNEFADEGMMEDAFETIDLWTMLLSVLKRLMLVLGVIPSLPRFLKEIDVSTSLCPWKDIAGFVAGCG
jgi:hypothetical protein